MGTPDSVGAKLEELYQDFLFDEMIIISHYGGLKREQALRTTTALCRSFDAEVTKKVNAMNDSNKIEEMLKRLERLEAMEEIRHLKQRSAQAADPHMKIDMFVNLYTEDGVMEFTNWDTVLRGHDEIRAFLEVNPVHLDVPLPAARED